MLEREGGSWRGFSGQLCFGSRVRRFKGDNAVIPYAAYSWMLVVTGNP